MLCKFSVCCNFRKKCLRTMYVFPDKNQKLLRMSHTQITKQALISGNALITTLIRIKHLNTTCINCVKQF